jgi:hypothetical protein
VKLERASGTPCVCDAARKAAGTFSAASSTSCEAEHPDRPNTVAAAVDSQRGFIGTRVSPGNGRSHRSFDGRLDLAQIRKAFGSTPPDLVQVLDLQVKTLAAKKIAADRAIALLQSAMLRLRSQSHLSIDELCLLLRNTEMANMQTVVRELINQHITPEQEREWLTYWAQQDPKDVQAGQEQMAIFRAIADEFLVLMRRGDQPDSPAAQDVAERAHRAWLKSNLRQRQLDQLAWNPEVTRAWFELGRKLLATYAEVCKEEDAGDPGLHARWIAAFAPNEQTRPGWEYLAKLCAA